MNSIRRWLYRPKRTDTSMLAQFFYADEDLNLVAAELDSFDGRKDPERCSLLVNQLRSCQDRVLNIIQQIMDEAIPHQRASRDFRVKFPDDVIQENLSGQLWFGAECLAAGSSIMNREIESASMRPLARALTKNLDSLRSVLREQCLRNINQYSERIRESLVIFDKLFAEFELSYVSAMVPVKTMREYDMVQEITVLFSETVQRAVKLGHLSEDMINEYDPALMFTIPRLAIVCGLLIHQDGPLNPDNGSLGVSEMFRPFITLLIKIRELLMTLTDEELDSLEKSLCSTEDHFFLTSDSVGNSCQTDFDGENRICSSVISSEISFHDALENPYTSVDSQSNSSEESGNLHNGGEQIATTSSYDDIPTSTRIEKQVDELNETLSGSLKKCDSNDSGLHSENTSNSESLYTVSSSDSQNTLSTAELSPLSEGEATPIGFSLEKELTSPACDKLKESKAATEVFNEIFTEEIGQLCAEILDEILESVCSICQNDSQFVSYAEENCEICSRDNQSSVPSVTETDTDGACRTVNSDTQSHRSDLTDSISGSDNESSLNIENDTTYVEPVVVPKPDGQTKKFKSKNGRRQRQNSSPFERLNINSKSGSNESDERVCKTCLTVPRIQRLRYTESWNSNCSTCQSRASSIEYECDKESCASSDTSSYTSDCNDDEEIALAVQAAETASRNEARSRFRSSSDMIHRLFVCISGVADQLQTNFASDLRNILRAVFDMNCSEPLMSFDTTSKSEIITPPSSNDAETSINRQPRTTSSRRINHYRRRRRMQDPPRWMPDDLSLHCLACKIPFTFVRRRHHCRNCGKIFCGRCSANSVPLPHFGHIKPVRVCNRCFMFQVTPFTVQSTSS
ncbi:lateral signaling target protein 2 homolog isoform X2 [Patella vulgata]|uniref:lateral signaling target protein 2 homolog isoform X2 n=1 Tax=Patella vulgata TaxID=6465 RepID=UPI0021802FF2|nr:lateral signaling target protein 2 homolog isoform X2 [Patella vulgata]